ncbi:MAG: penicillin-binding protein activator [Mariprofundales bacterium]
MLLLLVMVASCGKHEVVVSPPPVVSHARVIVPPVEHRVMDAQQDSAIDLVMREVRQGDLDPLLAQQQLAQIAVASPAVLADEARFRAVELQLEFDDPYADAAAERLLAARANHALIPYLHYWLSGWLQRHDHQADAQRHLAVVIDDDGAVGALRHQALQAGMAMVAAQPDDGVAVRWLLQRMPLLDGDDLLAVARVAAARSVWGLVQALHEQGVINRALFAAYYQEVARIALMRGDREFLATIAGWARQDIAGTAASRMIRRWNSGSSRAVNIGVLLPLSGQYARFGAQALHGVRMAVDRLPYGHNISLVVADSEGRGEATIAGYHRLIAAGCVAVIGPVLADDVQALAPYLHADVPVIALTNQRALAGLASPLFVHSVGAQVQTAFLAEWVRKQIKNSRIKGEHDQPLQAVVIASKGSASQASSALFRQLLEADGSVVVHQLTVEDAVDQRLQLIDLRRDTDDGMLLDELDQDLALFIAETDLQPALSANIVAIYLPLSGEQVVRLSGQLAYVGLNRVRLLGDSRWQDGHLLDDHGRYLTAARIVAVPSSQPTQSEAGIAASTEGRYRQLWGDHAKSLLSDVAFDSLVVAATLTSSWGLQGWSLLQALRDPGGFPLPTGSVVFDRQGVGHKRFVLLSVRDDALVVAQ